MKYDALIDSFRTVLPLIDDPDEYTKVVDEIARLRELQDELPEDA